MMREYYQFGRVWQTPRKEKAVLGILAFEVASLMSRLVGLWQSLEDDHIERLKREILNSEGVRELVFNEDDDYLLGLMLAEMFDTLGFVARAVIRLGKRCSNPVMESLEALLDDLVKKNMDPHGMEYNLIKMEKKVKKMERFVVRSRTLYEEMEDLSELEKGLNRMRGRGATDKNLKHKVVKQKQVVKDMQENSLWSRNYDYTVRLLVRSLYTIFRRMKLVFGINHPTVEATAESKVPNYLHLPPSQSISPLLYSSVDLSENNHVKLASSPLKSPAGTISCKLYNYRSKQPLTGSQSFRGCMVGCSGNKSLLMSSGTTKQFSHVGSFIDSNSSFFSTKYSLTSSPPPLTLGAAALELHYANVVIAIEKLMRCHHWIFLEEREDLYRMLPASIRAALRRRLKSYAKTMNSSVADKFANMMKQRLKWLAPLAHNTIKRHSEQTLELKQHLVSRKNVLLLQTLYYANQAKIEAAITELLVGLNYIYRFQGDEVMLEAKGCICFGDFFNGKG